MKSGIIKIWKYAFSLGLTLTILVSASTVKARSIPALYLTLKNDFTYQSILYNVIDYEQKNFRRGNSFGFKMEDIINCAIHFDFPNNYNPSHNHLLCWLLNDEENRINRSKIHIADRIKLSTEIYFLVDESSIFNEAGSAKPPQRELSIRHPGWGIMHADIFVLLLLSAAGIFFVKKTISLTRYKERRKAEIDRKTAELEVMALQAQMNPHFIFNSINSIQYFVLTNRTDDVLSYLSDFSKVVRASLGNITKKMIPLHEEIDTLKSYLRIEKMRFPDKFEYTLEIKASLDPLVKKIPPYLIQPIVENSVKHGFSDKNSMGHLTIALEEIDNETLKLTVTDDGIGRAQTGETDGYTLECCRPQSSVITEKRLRLLNSFEKPDRYKVVYTDLTDNEGNSAGLKVEVYLAFETI